MNPELLASVAGITLSLIMSYIPGLSDKFATLSSNAKRSIMAILIVISALGLAFWTCLNPEGDARFGACLGGLSWSEYLQAVIAALVSNQATFTISPKKEED